MKRFIACSCALALGLYFTNSSIHAQGKSGGGHGPSIDSSHAVDHSDHGSNAAHGKDLDNDGKSHGASHPNETHTKDIVDRINDNPALKAKVTSLLPNGMDLATAAAGFKNQGQFIAALNVSKNLGIPFAD